jgi:hypothetical protein
VKVFRRKLAAAVKKNKRKNDIHEKSTGVLISALMWGIKILLQVQARAVHRVHQARQARKDRQAFVLKVTIMRENKSM